MLRVDDESQQLLREVVKVVEQIYFDVTMYWAVITAEAPELFALIDAYKNVETRRAQTHELFRAAYEAVENREASQVRLALQQILTDLPAARVN